MNGWTAAELEQLKTLAGQGLSASQIGAKLGRNRNSIVGKIHRGKGAYGNLTPRPPAKGEKRRRDARRVILKAIEPPKKPTLAELFAQAPQPAANLPAVPPMTFLAAVNAGRCLHYSGDPFGPSGPDMPVCGAERSVHAGKVPYCLRHLRSALAVDCRPIGRPQALPAASRQATA